MFFSSLADIVESLASKHVIDEEYLLIVRRNHVISDAIKRMERPSFHPGQESCGE
jgi:hypothetical protein